MTFSLTWALPDLNRGSAHWDLELAVEEGGRRRTGEQIYLAGQKKTKEPLVFLSPRPKSAQSPRFWGGIYASLGSYTIISVPGNPNLAPTAWRLEGVEPYTETRQTLDEAGSWVKPHKENHGKWAQISKNYDHFWCFSSSFLAKFGVKKKLGDVSTTF